MVKQKVDIGMMSPNLAFVFCYLISFRWLLLLSEFMAVFTGYLWNAIFLMPQKAVNGSLSSICGLSSIVWTYKIFICLITHAEYVIRPFFSFSINIRIHCNCSFSDAVSQHWCYFSLFLQIDRIIPIAGDEDMLNFSHLFAETSKRNFSDDHLWFSVCLINIQNLFWFHVFPITLCDEKSLRWFNYRAHSFFAAKNFASVL